MKNQKQKSLRNILFDRKGENDHARTKACCRIHVWHFIQEAETGAETAGESESGIPLEPVHYVISEMYHGQGKVTIRDNFGNIYEIPGAEEAVLFECNEQTQLI